MLFVLMAQKWTVSEAKLVLRLVQYLSTTKNLASKFPVVDSVELASEMTGANSKLVKGWVVEWKKTGAC
jgi:hypothetical protein